MTDLKLFYCYAPKDKHWFSRLDRHLSSLKRDFQISTCSNHEVLAGKERKKEIDTQLSTANIILLLISSDFMDSDYCHSQEIEKALQRQKTGNGCCIPILLRPVDWESTPFSELQSLPANGRPISSWGRSDEALEDIARGIRKLLEKKWGKPYHKDYLSERKPENTNNVGRNIREKEQILEDVPDQMKHYLYISDIKVKNLEQQLMAWSTKETVSFDNRFHSLNVVLTHLRKKRQIWPINSGQTFRSNDYISGEYQMRWGTVNWGKKVCFFFASTPSDILLMAGSVHHLMSNHQPAEHLLKAELTGANGSDTPGILSAIEFAAEHSGVRWFDGIGDLSDYLFALALVQGKFFHQMKTKKLATSFPEQMVEFTALVLKTLKPPTEHQLADFFVNNAINQREQGEIKQMLQKSQKILICTPLYVALGNEQ